MKNFYVPTRHLDRWARAFAARHIAYRTKRSQKPWKSVSKNLPWMVCALSTASWRQNMASCQTGTLVTWQIWAQYKLIHWCLTTPLQVVPLTDGLIMGTPFRARNAAATDMFSEDTASLVTAQNCERRFLTCQSTLSWVWTWTWWKSILGTVKSFTYISTMRSSTLRVHSIIIRAQTYVAGDRVKSNSTSRSM